MSTRVLGIALLLHGLAHAGPGMWAFDRAPAWLFTALFGAAMVGFLAAGFGLLGLPIARQHSRSLALGAAMSSIGMTILLPDPVLLVGCILDLLVILIALRWPYWETPESARRRTLRVRAARTAAFGFMAYVAVLLLARPWHLRWGASDLDLLAAFPGDQRIPDARYRLDHVVTIRAPADSVRPWLAQTGQDRAEFKPYAWLENLIGDNWAAFVVRPVDRNTSRLHSRIRGDGQPSFSGVPLGPVGLLVLEPAHFILERGMLRGIRARAERQFGGATVAARRAASMLR